MIRHSRPKGPWALEPLAGPHVAHLESVPGLPEGDQSKREVFRFLEQHHPEV
jgi:hypothetical protein